MAEDVWKFRNLVMVSDVNIGTFLGIQNVSISRYYLAFIEVLSILAKVAGMSISFAKISKFLANTKICGDFFYNSESFLNKNSFRSESKHSILYNS